MTVVEIDNTMSPDTVLHITEDTELYVNEHAHIRQILIDANCTLHIKGGALEITNPQHGVGIGVDGDFGLSFGRWSIKDSPSQYKVIVDCNSLKIRTATANCGIGNFGMDSRDRFRVTPNCVNPDFYPQYIPIVCTVEGSTKISKYPEYVTEEDFNARKLQRMQTANELRGSHYVSQRVLCDMMSYVNSSDIREKYFQECVTRLRQGGKDRFTEACVKLYATAVKLLQECRSSYLMEALEACTVYATFFENAMYQQVRDYSTPARLLSIIHSYVMFPRDLITTETNSIVDITSLELEHPYDKPLPHLYLYGADLFKYDGHEQDLLPARCCYKDGEIYVASTCNSRHLLGCYDSIADDKAIFYLDAHGNQTTEKCACYKFTATMFDLLCSEIVKV